VLAIKDYLVVAGFAFALYYYRRSVDVTSGREGGLFAGCAVLLGVFLPSTPFSNALVALAVQLPFNRVFWLLDIVGVVYCGWLLFERQPWRRAPARVGHRTPRRAVVVVVALVALTHGSYRVFVERARSLVERYDIDFLLTERRLDLPIAFATGRFGAYGLDGV
jgi:hypothetical protein